MYIFKQVWPGQTYIFNESFFIANVQRFFDRSCFFCVCVYQVWKDHPCFFTCFIYPVQDGKGMLTTSAINDNCPISRDMRGLCQYKVICSMLLKTPIKCSEDGPSKRSTANCASSINQEAVSLGIHDSSHCQQEKKKKAFLKIVTTKTVQLTPIFLGGGKIVFKAFLCFMLMLIVKHWAPEWMRRLCFMLPCTQSQIIIQNL